MTTRMPEKCFLSKTVLTACFAGGLLLGSAGCPGSDRGGEVQGQSSSAAAGGSEKSKAAAKAGPGNADAKVWTPLMQAAYEGNLEAVKALVTQADTDINHADIKGWTPLMVASQKGHADVARLLIEQD